MNKYKVENGILIKLIKRENVIFLGSFLFIISLITGTKQNNSLSIIILEGIFLGYLGLTLFYKESSIKVMTQSWIINILMTFFWLAAICSKYTKKDNLYLIIIGMFCLSVVTIIESVRIIKSNGLIIYTEKIRENWLLIVLICLFSILSMDVMNTFPRWDSLVYFQHTPDTPWCIIPLAYKFDFSFRNIFEYNLATHTSLGYTFFCLLGVFLYPNSANGIYLINIILGVCAIISFYGILGSVLYNVTTTEKMLATLIFAFSPFLFGMVGSINLDYPMLCYLAIFLYCYFRKYNIFLFFSGLFLAFAKEPGIIYVCMAIGGIYLSKFIKNKEKNFLIRILKIIDVKELFCFLCIPLVWLILYISNTNSSWGNGTGSPFRWDNEGFNCFGFNFKYILAKLEQLFLLNWNWLLSVITLAGCLVYFLNVKKCKEKCNIFNIIPFLCTFIAIIVFNCLFITVKHARYLLPECLILSLITVVGIYCIFNNKKFRCFLYFIISIIILAQNYRTFDPVTNCLYPKLNVGKTNIISLWGEGNFAFLDSIVYNRQYLDWDKSLNRSFDQINYDDSTVVVIPNISPNMTMGQSARYSLFGDFGYTYWNKNKKVFQIEKNEDNCLVNIIEVDQYNDTIYKQYDKIYLLLPAWYDKIELKEFLRCNTIQNTENISFRGWDIEMLKLK